MGLRIDNPPHPGEIVWELCLQPAGLSVTESARRLGVSRKALSELINGHVGVSPEMAVRLSLLFGTSAESWLRSQIEFDLWKARKKLSKIKVARLKAG